MNYARLALAAVSAFVVDAVYGFVVYGNALAGQFAQYPDVYRPADDTSHMAFLFLGILVAAAAASYIYAKGYEGGSGLSEGLRFGAAMGVFVVGYAALINWAVLKVGRYLFLGTAAAGFVEWLLIGLVIGLVYRPVARPARSATV